MRRKHLLKITHENQNILTRLQGQRSFYSVQKWENDFQRRDRVLRKMCEYPYVLNKSDKSTINASLNESQ